MPDPVEQWQLNGLVDRILDHFGYPTRLDKTCGLEIASNDAATLTLCSPKGNPMIAFMLRFINDDDMRLNQRKRQSDPNIEQTGWMIWEIKQMFPDSLIEIRKATA